MKTKKLAYWASVTTLGIVLGVSLQFVKAWTEPTATAPNGNVGAPINSSSIAQTKAGALVLNTAGAATGLVVAKGDLQLTGAPGTNGVKFPDGTLQTTAASGGAASTVTYIDADTTTCSTSQKQWGCYGYSILNDSSYKFCALTREQHRIYDNTGDHHHDISSCEVVYDAAQGWVLSAYINFQGDTPNFNSYCRAACFK